MSTNRKWLVAGIVLATVIVLFAGTWLIAQFFFAPSWGGPGGMMRGPWFEGSSNQNGVYASNGEQIYFTGTSRTGPQITSQMQGEVGMPMMDEHMACADCHGANGEGGTVRMMMTTVEVPNIQYEHLTEAEHMEGEEEHPPFTDETIKQAITQGVDPAGEPLEWPMPIWNMTDDQANDVIAFLKTLH